MERSGASEVFGVERCRSRSGGVFDETGLNKDNEAAIRYKITIDISIEYAKLFAFFY